MPKDEPARVARIVVVGLGPGPSGLVTIDTVAAIAAIEHRFVRTARHPSIDVVGEARSFDDLYDRAPRIDDVYPAIVDELVAAAHQYGEILYAVPGSPLVAERTVELLLTDRRVDVDVCQGMSFAELTWSRLRIDPVASGVRMVDGRRFATEAAGERGPLLVAQCDSRAVLSDIKLAVEGEPSGKVVVLQRLGLPDERVFEVEWADLDREVDPDHLTSLYVPVLADPIGAELVRLAEIGRELRAGCPWDKEQTHESLTKYLLEESYEVIEAIDHLPAEPEPADYEHLEEELGDVLFQVVFHAAIAAESGAFTLADVARGIADKLVRRHPHVFGDLRVAGADEVVDNWETLKRTEKGRESALDGITSTLPALMLAAEVVKKARRLDVLVERSDRIDTDGTLTVDVVGDLLLSVVASSRDAGIDAEAALRAAAFRLADEARRRESATAAAPD
jgi:tetrapyrrole methylase family protein / MazG family protein